MRTAADRRAGIARGSTAVVASAIILVAGLYLYFDFSPTLSNGSKATSESKVMVSMPDGVGSNESLNFAPTSIVVVIGVNNTVSWVNNDMLHNHTVTSTAVPTGAITFNSLNMVRNAVFTVTFTTPGVYEYVCSYHPWM